MADIFQNFILLPPHIAVEFIKKKKRNAAQLATLALADFANLQLNNEENCF